MNPCKHELSYLMGTKDGIVCRKCGRLFKTYAELDPPPAPAPAEKPKRQRKVKKDA